MRPSEAIEHLILAGLSETAIGSEVGANQSTINRIRRGKSPRFELGSALVALAKRTPLPEPAAKPAPEAETKADTAPAAKVA